MFVKKFSAMLLFTIITLIVLSPTTSLAEEELDVSYKTITPTDVFLHVARVQAELELLRFHMGKPKPQNTGHTLNVSDAAPREVFYQALTLLEKSNQLSFDHLRMRTATPNTPPINIRPADVFNVVDHALNRVRAVKKHIGIQKAITEPTLNQQKNPTNVLLAIMQVNRQLNLLLDQQFAPKDVFKEISVAISYSSKLLASFPNVARTPTPEALQTGKRPVDVFRRLIRTYNHIRLIAARSNLTMLRLDTNLPDNQVAPSDVYDIASLIVSELAYMNSKLPRHTLPRPVFDSGRKFPSDVFQRASILKKQIELIDTLSKDKPQWLVHLKG